MMPYLHKLFELVHGIRIFSPINIFIYLCQIDSRMFNLCLIYTLYYFPILLLFCFSFSSLATVSSFRWLLYSFNMFLSIFVLPFSHLLPLQNAKLTLCISLPSHKVNHLFKKPQCFLLDSSIRNQGLGAHCSQRVQALSGDRAKNISVWINPCVFIYLWLAR